MNLIGTRSPMFQPQDAGALRGISIDAHFIVEGWFSRSGSIVAWQVALRMNGVDTRRQLGNRSGYGEAVPVT